MAKQASVAPIVAPPVSEIKSWLVIGLDLSVSRTGYAIFLSEKGERKVLRVGSIKPTDASEPVWSRAVLTCKFLAEQILMEDEIARLLPRGFGVIISCEMFTPRNDFLSSMNRVMNSIVLGSTSPLFEHVPINNLYINASTLRSFMGLKQRGAKNKTENIAKAFTFIDKDRFVKLDTDACDAVLMAQVGHYAASLVSGFPDGVPIQFARMLCDSTVVVKGKGVRAKTITKGLLHNPNYWFPHQTKLLELAHTNAEIKGKPEKVKILI